MKDNTNKMKKYIIFIFIAVTCIPFSTNAENIIYKKSDSILVEQYLREASHLHKNANKVLFFARKFMGRPYVAHTLEIGDNEQLVVNLEELDCTTYVDIVCALTQSSRFGKTTFEDFCYYLRHQRYPHGVIRDYTSRNHYFSSWILNCEEQGFTHEITSADCIKGKSPFTAQQKIHCNYMSKHPNLYKALSAHPEFIKGIKTTESYLSHMSVSYIPNDNLGLPPKKLSCIKDGDILALVTNKEGLDISHLGFAVWKKGKLHLLNASGLYHKVLVNKETLQQYNLNRKSNIGTRVIRINTH